MKEKKVTTKWRLEYWAGGRKYVRVFGSKAQAEAFLKSLGSFVHDSRITQERSKE